MNSFAKPVYIDNSDVPTCNKPKQPKTIYTKVVADGLNQDKHTFGEKL